MRISKKQFVHSLEIVSREFYIHGILSCIVGMNRRKIAEHREKVGKALKEKKNS